MKKNKIPGEGEYTINGLIREMQKKDISGVYKLLSENLAKY
jgi:hypothetical protein